MKIGFGFDIHKLIEDMPLILGGVHIPHSKGLLGHSDADVLTHAIIDSLLGAASLGDIGTHFPDTDRAYKGINSQELLKETKCMLENNKLQIKNIDTVIIAEKPKISAYVVDMKEVLCQTLEIKKDQINIKATTAEKIGACGREEAIAATAVCLLEGRNEHSNL